MVEGEPVRKKKKKKESLKGVPVELLSNILSRLPPSSLPSARLVCKAWKAVLRGYCCRTSSSSSHRSNLLWLKNRCRSACLFRNQESDILSFAVPHVVAPPSAPSYLRLIHSTDGLLCFGSGSQLLVCNPLARAGKFLPLTASIQYLETAALLWDKTSCSYCILAVGTTKTRSDDGFYVHYPFYENAVELYNSTCGTWELQVPFISDEYTRKGEIFTFQGDFFWYISTGTDSDSPCLLRFNRASRRWEKSSILTSSAQPFMPFESIPKMFTLGPDLYSASKDGGEFLIWNTDGIWSVAPPSFHHKQLHIDGLVCAKTKTDPDGLQGRVSVHMPFFKLPDGNSGSSNDSYSLASSPHFAMECTAGEMIAEIFPYTPCDSNIP